MNENKKNDLNGFEDNDQEIKTEEKKIKETRMIHSLVTFAVLVGVMSAAIIHYEVDPHVPMFIGVIASACVALYLGYSWKRIEKAMMDGIYRALQSIMILAIIGILIGVWIVSGVVPAMIYYGLKLLSPSIFLVATVLICSITSLATGTSWGTMGTMGLALMGIATGLGIPSGVTAGAVISGAYFGDKLSPLSDTTNLAPAMAGTDVFTHIKFMLQSTLVAYVITLVFFAFMGFHYVSGGQTADLSSVNELSSGLKDAFNINPALLLPPLIVIVAMAFKIPAIPGITLGIIAGAICGMIFQWGDCSFGDILGCGMNGYESHIGIKSLDSLLTSGGLVNMMSSIALTMIAMMFGGIMEETGQLRVIVEKLMGLVKGPVGLVAMTEVTCMLSNVTMPEQYISIVVPGRMFAGAYKEKDLHPKTLSNALESAGTVTSALVPWNTCGVFIKATLGITTMTYLPYAVFNYSMPVICVVMAAMGLTLADKDGVTFRAAKKKEKSAAK